MIRGRATWLIYAAFACTAFLLNGLGAVLVPLQRELGVTRGDIAIYPTLFAAGLVVVGLTGGSLIGRTGRRAGLALAMGLMVAGGLLLAVPGRIPTLAGDVMVGLGAALMIQLVPALLAALHPGRETAAVGEVNGVASAASVLAPLAVAFSIALGLGWRAGYLGPALIVLAAVVWPLSRAAVPPAPGRAPGPGAETAPLLGRWIDLVLAVSVEFCMVFWAASAFVEWHGARAAEAPALASLFLVGMAVSRGLASPITRRVADPRSLIWACCGVAAAGFALFWAAPALALGAAGLAVTGLGVALLYPTTISRLIAAWPGSPDRASARAALGSGLAIGGAPFVLGRLSDAIGLRAAYLIVPVLLVLLVFRGARTRAGG
ncbi:MAG TPA: MFS transporter [Candidatus Dormibacteraeota bacterium]|nr:MFS transporter [Candidatus Dormibacteraeota bacterium]